MEPRPTISPNRFEASFAQNDDDLRAAQKLRYEVFVKELGGSGPLVDHEKGLEIDEFDSVASHLILRDLTRPVDDNVVAVYRLMSSDQASRFGGFYSDSEFDLSPLVKSGRSLLELGRSCLHRDYRGGSAMMELWQALAQHVLKNDYDVLFGVASFHGTDPDTLAQPLSFLWHHHLAPKHLRVTSKTHQAMDLLPMDQIDRKAALMQIPSLIKAYLRLGGCVGDGAFVDHAFNTTDVCLVMDTARLNKRARAIYGGEVLG